jgi:pyruvate carboxylase
MKMLNNVVAEISGRVAEILVAPGDRVEVGDPLLVVRTE